MQAGGELVLQGGVDQPLARHPALSFERRRHDLYPEVGLAALAPAGMAVVMRRLVLDGEACRRQLSPELVVNRHRDLAHRSPLLPGQTVEHILVEWPDGERTHCRRQTARRPISGSASRQAARRGANIVRPARPTGWTNIAGSASSTSANTTRSGT